MAIGHLTNGGIAMFSATLLTAEVTAGTNPDVIGLVEKGGITAAFGVLLWYFLGKQSKQLDDNTLAIRELAQAIAKMKE